MATTYEVVRRITDSNGVTTQWGPDCFDDDKTNAVKQIQTDLETLINSHVDSGQPFKTTFEQGDTVTASFTFHEPTIGTNTITWKIKDHIG